MTKERKCFMFKNKEELKKELKKLAKNMIDNKDIKVTDYLKIEHDNNNNTWAIVFRWIDTNNDNNYELCGKCAYQSNNALMTEHNYNWVMPYDTTEIPISENTINEDIEYLANEYERIRHDYLLDKKILDTELEDDNTPDGGIDYAGETVQDFLDFLKNNTENKNGIIHINKLNNALKECGIKTIT